MTLQVQDDITAFFSRDHRAIDAELELFRAESSPGKAAPRLEHFAGLLFRHIAWEERTLFPAFERKLGEEAGARVQSMTIQHEELRGHIAALRASLDQGPQARRNAEAVLAETLDDHNHAEELFIYPWMDAVLSADERREVLAALENP